MTKLPIVIGIAAENTDAFLEATLQNAAKISDRIFLVAPKDSPVGSHKFDKSINLLTTEAYDDESSIKNALIDVIEAENEDEWLLWLEPGESFDAATVGELNEFLAEFRKEENDRNSIYVMVLHRLVRSDGGRHDLDEETIDARLMPLGKNLRFQGRVKSSLMPSAETLMIEISAAPGRILCPPHHQNRDWEKQQGENSLRILAEMEKAGEKIDEEKLALRAESYALIGEYGPARQCFHRLIDETKQENLRLSAYYRLWETTTVSPINSGEMTKFLLAGLDHFPLDMQLLTFMGAHLQRMGKLDIAARTFETAVNYGQISLDVWHRLRIREIAVTSLALVQRLRGRAREAIRIMETNLETITDRSEFSRHLLDIYIAERMDEKAKEFAATVWGGEELDQIRLALTGACLATAGMWNDAIKPLEQAFDDGCRDPLCLRWYSLTQLSLLRFEQAVETLQLWLEVEPGNTEAQSYLFAARHPESFGEIMRTIQNAQLNSLGIAGAELFRKDAGKKMEGPKKGSRAIDDAVREMVASSGTPGKIRCFKPTSQAKPEESASDR